MRAFRLLFHIRCFGIVLVLRNYKNEWRLHLNNNCRRSRLPFVIVFTLFLGIASSSFASDPAITWLKIPLTTFPSGRGAMAMVYDGVSKKVILFGGFGPTSYLNDTWTWDGAKWTQIATALAPSPRAASGIGFDRVTGKVVLFGGFDGNTY